MTPVHISDYNFSGVRLSLFTKLQLFMLISVMHNCPQDNCKIVIFIVSLHNHTLTHNIIGANCLSIVCGPTYAGICTTIISDHLYRINKQR